MAPSNLRVDQIVDSHDDRIGSFHLIELELSFIVGVSVGALDHIGTQLLHVVGVVHLLLDHFEVLNLVFKLLLLLLKFVIQDFSFSFATILFLDFVNFAFFTDDLDLIFLIQLLSFVLNLSCPSLLGEGLLIRLQPGLLFNFILFYLNFVGFLLVSEVLLFLVNCVV